MADKKVSFGYQDAGLGAGMDGYLKKARTFTDQNLENSKNIKQSGKEQMQFLDAQIKALEQRNKLEAQYARVRAQDRMEADKANKSAAVRNAAEDKYKDRLSSISASQAKNDVLVELARQQLEELRKLADRHLLEQGDPEVRQFIEDQKSGNLGGYAAEDVARLRIEADKVELKDKEAAANAAKPTSGQAKSMMAFMGGMMMDRLIGNMGAVTSARNSLDWIGPSAGVSGGLAGALLGTGLEAGTGGQIEYATIGARLGEAVGSAAGAGLVRHLEALNEVQKGQFSLGARYGGMPMSISDLSGVGVSQAQSLEIAMQLSRSGLYGAASLGRKVTDYVYAGKAYGLGDDTMQGNIMAGRTGIGNEDLRISGGRARAVADRFNMGRQMAETILSASNQLGTNLSGVVGSQDRSQLMATLMSFNGIGGQFGVGDTRSMSNIMAVHQGLSSPTNEYMQAMSFSAIREMNPSASLFETLKIQQQGINNPEYLARSLKQITDGGGNSDYQKWAISKRFGLEGNLAGAEELFNNREAIMGGRVTKGGIDAMLAKGGSSEAEFAAEAKKKTTQLEKENAAVQNAYVISMEKGVDTVSGYFKDRMETAVDYLIKKMNPLDGGGKKENPIPPPGSKERAVWDKQVKDNVVALQEWAAKPQ